MVRRWPQSERNDRAARTLIPEGPAFGAPNPRDRFGRPPRSGFTVSRARARPVDRRRGRAPRRLDTPLPTSSAGRIERTELDRKLPRMKSRRGAPDTAHQLAADGCAGALLDRIRPTT